MFSGITVSQGSVATYAKCGGILITVYCKFTIESSSEKNENRLRFDRIMAMSFEVSFVGPLYISKLSVTPVVAAMSTSPSQPVSTTPGYRILLTLLFFNFEVYFRVSVLASSFKNNKGVTVLKMGSMMINHRLRERDCSVFKLNMVL